MFAYRMDIGVFQAVAGDWLKVHVVSVKPAVRLDLHGWPGAHEAPVK